MLRLAVLSIAALGLVCAVPADASNANRYGQPASPGAQQQIGSAPAQPNPVIQKRRPRAAEPVDTPLRTDTVVLGANVGPGIAPTPAIAPQLIHTPPIIRAPPDWRGTEAEWEDHVKLCDAQIGATDWFTGAYIATADLLARCPFDRGAEGPIRTARGRHGEHARGR